MPARPRGEVARGTAAASPGGAREGILEPMDFRAVMERVGGFLSGKRYPWAVIGGLAMAAYGLPRTTLDLDLVTVAAAQEELVAFLESAGYETLHRSPGYSNHLHPDADAGRVDVVYVRGGTADAIFGRVRRMPLRGGGEMPVVAPEHLAAMKAFAMKNDPARTHAELADVAFLLSLPEVDREAVRESFRRYGLEEHLDEILARIDRA